MFDLSIRYFTENDSKAWDEFVERSHKSTFQHNRKFLKYHKQRFVDRSLIIEEGNKFIGVLPAAEDPSNSRVVISHIGATYGGLITTQSYYGEQLILLLSEICKFYRSEGYAQLIYKATPSVFHATTDEDEIYALFRVNAELYRVDNNAIIHRDARLKISSQRKRSHKKAKKAELSLERGFENLEAFYSVLSVNLSKKHDSRPVHNIDELHELKSLFDKEIDLVVAKNKFGEVISGVLFFKINNVLHSQYIASSSEGYDCGGLDFIFESEIERLAKLNKTHLSFGTSNEEQGMVLNQSLYRFKRQFGAGAVAHYFFSIKL